MKGYGMKFVELHKDGTIGSIAYEEYEGAKEDLGDDCQVAPVLTQKEFDEHPDCYKSMINEQAYVLYLTYKGTTLGPAVILTEEEKAALQPKRRFLVCPITKEKLYEYDDCFHNEATTEYYKTEEAVKEHAKQLGWTEQDIEEAWFPDDGTIEEQDNAIIYFTEVPEGVGDFE